MFCIRIVMDQFCLWENNMKFRDIPQMTRPGYSVDYDLYDLQRVIKRYQYETLCPLNMEPDFQRVHIWTPYQQSRYVEFILQGGNSSKDIYFNCPGWMTNWKGPFELVDGKQRLEACLSFLRGSLSIFGGIYAGDFTDKPACIHGTLKFHINNLETRQKVLQWYLDINSGGVVHTNDELDKVRKLLEKEITTAKPI